MDILFHTTREEIYHCIEASRECLPMNEVKQMLFFSDIKDLEQFMEEVRFLSLILSNYLIDFERILLKIFTSFVKIIFSY